MDIQKRIDKLGKMFGGMNVAQGYICVKVLFPQKWAISEATESEFNTIVAPEENTNLLCFITEISNGFDKLFDAIDYNIEFNRDALEKAELLKSYIEQLKDIFNVEDIKTLKTIKISYRKRNKSTAKKAKVKEVAEETITETPEEKETVKDE